MFVRIEDDSCCWWQHSAVSGCFQSVANLRDTFSVVLVSCTRGSSLSLSFCRVWTHSRKNLDSVVQISQFDSARLGNFIPEISKLFKSSIYFDGLCACSTTGFRMYERQYRKFLSPLFLIFTVAFLLWICLGKGVCVEPHSMSYVRYIQLTVQNGIQCETGTFSFMTGQ